MTQQQARVDAFEAVHLDGAEHGARSSRHLQRHRCLAPIAIDDDVPLHVGECVAERVEALFDQILLRQVKGVVEHLSALDEKVPANVARASSPIVSRPASWTVASLVAGPSSRLIEMSTLLAVLPATMSVDTTRASKNPRAR